jgi:hypothetical protein
VSEENSAAVEEVGASAEEMSAQVEEVTASAQSPAEMAEALRQIVSRFKLSTEQLPTKKEFQAQKPILERASLHQASVAHVLHRNNGHTPVKAH